MVPNDTMPDIVDLSRSRRHSCPRVPLLVTEYTCEFPVYFRTRRIASRTGGPSGLFGRVSVEISAETTPGTSAFQRLCPHCAKWQALAHGRRCSSTCEGLSDACRGEVAVVRRGVQLLVTQEHPRFHGGRLWITRMSTFCSRRWVAKQCLKLCNETRLSIPAASLAPWKA